MTTAVVAAVAGGRDDGDTEVDEPLGRLGQRIHVVRLGDRRANRQVDDADVVTVLVVIRGHPVERRDDIGDRAVAIAIENLENGQRRARRDAGVLAARILAVPRENAGHVRAVAEIVVRHLVSVDEVHESVDALGAGDRIDESVDVDRTAIVARRVVAHSVPSLRAMKAAIAASTAGSATLTGNDVAPDADDLGVDG